MAFKTLDELRTVAPGLNTELGLVDDADNSFGNTGQRNAFIQRAFAKLWPRVGKLARESLTTVANQQEYALTVVQNVERIEIIDPNTGTLISDRIRSWQNYIDEGTDPATNRLLVTANLTEGLTLHVIGFKPYLIPANGGASCDLPSQIEHVLIAGARVEAYRAKVNSFANFERFANENRSNALSAADIIELLRQAQREFDRGLAENGRNLTGAHRARLQTG